MEITVHDTGNLPEIWRFAMHMQILTATPQRITTNAVVWNRQAKIGWIKGPRPVQQYFVTHVMDMKCNMCSFVLQIDGKFELKYINRQCNHHRHLLGLAEVQGA